MEDLNKKANLFGDARAENDHEMLDLSFYEGQDYKTLHESNDRFIVVGRRGTGKSALTYKLQKQFKEKKEYTIVIAPNEEEMLGLRAIATQFGDSVTRIRSGIKLAWRYALLMEIGSRLEVYYKTENAVANTTYLQSELKKWKNSGNTTIEKLRLILRGAISSISSPEDRIADLPKILNLNSISIEVLEILTKYDQKYAILTDRLDEGYEPDIVGIGIVDGLIYGTDEIRTYFKSRVRTLIFLRDNIFRAIEDADQDFSRNIEGQVLRLHWDPLELFHLINNRIRIALKMEHENDIRVWNKYVSEELRGIEGFKNCLKLTLYRPRDLLALMNVANLQARKQDRLILIQSDIESAAKRISETRFDDLSKEYHSVFPGIKAFTNVFLNGRPNLTVEEASEKISNVLDSKETSSDALQFSKILGGSEEIIKALYGIGFFGIVDASGKYVFSHDGKRPNISISSKNLLLIHPCYWIALNLNENEDVASVKQDIYDEYEITISSESKELRDKMLGQHMSALNTISMGADDAHEFEAWCKKAIEIIFIGNLTNIELHPNKQHAQRRDIVATNQGHNGIWKRIREDYLVRQVIFEVKNFENLRTDEYRQMSGYLGREYGSLGFIICRDSVIELSKGKDLEAFREFYSLKQQLIIKLTAKQIINMLSKLRSVQKNQDDIDKLLDKHIDNHIRLYANGQSQKIK